MWVPKRTSFAVAHFAGPNVRGEAGPAGGGALGGAYRGGWGGTEGGPPGRGGQKCTASRQPGPGGPPLGLASTEVLGRSFLRTANAGLAAEPKLNWPNTRSPATQGHLC